ncbi:MAG: hypothetical protein AB1585_19195, partial [Thermodesulfobacteriota bacterium]
RELEEEGHLADQLVKDGWEYYGQGNKMPVGEINPGDRVLIQGEEYQHTGFDRAGKAVLKDGETIKADPFEMVPAAAKKDAGADLMDQIYNTIRANPKKITAPEYTPQALMREHGLNLEQAREIHDQVRARIIEREQGKVAGVFRRIDKLEAAGENPKAERARLLRIKNNLLTLGLTPEEAEGAFGGQGRFGAPEIGDAALRSASLEGGGGRREARGEEGGTPELVRVLDVYGSHHYVKKTELDSSKTQLRKFTPQGARVEGKTLHRENIVNESETAKVEEVKKIARLRTLEKKDQKGTLTPKEVEEGKKLMAEVYKAPTPKPGPGAQTAGTGVRETPSDIVQLAQSLEAVTSPRDSVRTRIRKALDWTVKAEKTKDVLSAALDRVKTTGGAIYQGWRRPAPWTEFKDMLGDYLMTRQQSSFENEGFAKKITKQIPSKTRREAIVNYIQAGGDQALIQTRAAQSGPRYKPGYEEALKLNADEQRFADNVGNYFDSKLAEAVKNGMVRQGVENYVSQLYDRSDPRYQSIMAEIDAGLLKKDPYFIKKRIFHDYFEAEQAGLVPKNKDIGYLLSTYDQAFNEAVASRTFVRALMDGKAGDGRPLADISGFGKVIPAPEGTDTAGLIVKPKSHPRGTNDYRVIDHPALREWKWLTEEALGDPVLMEGDMLIHPEVYRHLKAVLSKSKIQQHPVGKATLRTIQEFKSTLLSASGFHQTQETLHAIFHKVNPAKIGEIDFNNPVQRQLVKHGLMVSEYGGMEYFSDGLHASGLINKVPGIGHLSRRYGEYLFRDYIPRLKMRMAQEAVERNFKRYRGKLSDDQIYEITANQANAAFGELNYKMMGRFGRSKTTQDILRIMCLAPDFLEARARFVGQALKPYGREQGAALIRGALGMYLGARVVNYLLSDDPHWDKPFSVVIKGKEYGLRSVPGDIIHLISNPQSFVYWRLNPTTIRTAVEWATGRDARGQKKNTEEQVKEFFTTHVPIPLQGLVKGSGANIVDSVLASMGFTSWKNRSKAERLISDINFEKISKGDRDPRLKEIGLIRSRFFREYEKTRKVPEETKKAVRQGKVGTAQVVEWMKAAERPALIRGFEHLSVEEAARVWEVAKPEEKKVLAPIYIKKINNRMKAIAQGKSTLMPDLEGLEE